MRVDKSGAYMQRVGSSLAKTTMKIKNPAIVAAIKKAAHTLNVSADEVLEYLLEDTAERIK